MITYDGVELMYAAPRTDRHWKDACLDCYGHRNEHCRLLLTCSGNYRYIPIEKAITLRLKGEL